MNQTIDPILWEEFESVIREKPKIDYIPLKSYSVKYSNHKPFWDKFLTETFPSGKINQTLEKNLAIWLFINGADIEQVKHKYSVQGWKPGGLLGWIKKISQGDISEYNPGEIYLWCKQNNRLDLGELIKDKEISKPDNISNEIRIFSDEELQNYVERTSNWIVENLVKSGGIIVLAGKRATLKSWLMLNQAYCIANGLDFLGKFKTSKGAVLYVDRENQFTELKIRSRLIKQGLNIENGDVHFISESYIKIDDGADIQRLEKIIEDRNITLLILDVYRRLISFDENDAREVSKLFVDILKPLTERTGVAIILIHHEKKGESSGDEMDMLRGSSDLANYVDGIIQLVRKGDTLTIKQNKNRAGKEVEPFQVNVESDETSYFKFTYKGELETTINVISKFIVKWIRENSINEFTYTQVINFCKQQDFKKNSIIQALSNLQNKGIIFKDNFNRKSPYQVSKDIVLGEFNG